MVREISTRELCFKYYDPRSSKSNDFEYIYVACIVDDASIVWSDIVRPTFDREMVSFVSSKTVKPSWEYVTNVGTSIFDVQVLPPGSKRKR